MSDRWSHDGEEEHDALLDSKEESGIPQAQRGRLNTGARLLTCLNILLFSTSLAILFIATKSKTSLSHSLRGLSAYSPVLEAEDISMIDYKVSGELFPKDDGSDLLGRAVPGPATDELWEDFEYQRMFAITSEQVRKLGKDPAQTIKFPAEIGLGDDAYMAALDVFHQIHCLNVLRQEAFKDYYWDGQQYPAGKYTRPPVRSHSDYFWIHMRHCTDMILQTLMCSANTEMITMTWMETQENPWPDFNVNKKCIDFDALLKWRSEQALDKETILSMKKPYDLTKMSEKYWDLFPDGNDTGHH